MNKIIVEDGSVRLKSIDTSIEVEIEEKVDIYDITKLNIIVYKDTALEIQYKGNDTKIDVRIEVLKSVRLELNEIKKEKNIKVQNRYYLEENSYMNVHKFYDSFKVKELDVIFLNGEDAKIDYTFKTISKEKQQYDVIVYHNHYRTICNIDNKGVTIKKGSIILNVTGIVYSGIKGCIIDQKNRIINMNDSDCEINPNLLIEENEVIANHSAYIGNFKEDDIFYLQSRGITKEQAINLLIKGFLYEDNKNVKKIIEEYWR